MLPCTLVTRIYFSQVILQQRLGMSTVNYHAPHQKQTPSNFSPHTEEAPRLHPIAVQTPQTQRQDSLEWRVGGGWVKETGGNGGRDE